MHRARLAKLLSLVQGLQAEMMSQWEGDGGKAPASAFSERVLNIKNNILLSARDTHYRFDIDIDIAI